MRLSICLKKHGTGFKVSKMVIGEEGSISHEPLTVEEANTLHPVIAQLITANTSAEIVAAITDLKVLAKQDMDTVTAYTFINKTRVNKYENFTFDGLNGEKVEFSMMHKHGPYLGHNDIKGAAHRESFNSMIQFVEHPELREEEAIDQDVPKCQML